MTSKQTKTVKLNAPITIEGKEPVESVEIRKPFSGEMRGLKFTNILEMDVDTMFELLPRISNLSARDCLNIDPVDYAPLFTAVAGFFVTVDSQTA